MSDESKRAVDPVMGIFVTPYEVPEGCKAIPAVDVIRADVEGWNKAVESVWDGENPFLALVKKDDISTDDGARR